MGLTIANYVHNPAAGGKFVVLTARDGRGDDILALSDFTLDSQHRDIVSRWSAMADDTAAGYRPAGGGWWRYDSPLLEFYGQSAAYGKYDIERLRRQVRPGSVFAESELSFR